MSNRRRAEFVPYQPRKILNKNKRADHWFWSRYSAYPYLGCQHGCKFCYCRERKYSPYEDIEDFSYLIKVKENAPELLRKELRGAPLDVVFTGDYQPLERKFGLSRKMLMVCADLGFPVMVLERSPLVLRDLDVLEAIHGKARAVVAFSVIYTAASPAAGTLRRMEGLAPPPARRFAAMEQLSARGIPTGISLMPVLPGLCDDRANLEEVIRAAAGHGGSFVLAGGLTLGDQQRTYFLSFLQDQSPGLLPFYQKMYPQQAYGLPEAAWRRTAVLISELCEKYGLTDRMPRPVVPGEKREFNKRLVETLANHSYRLEIGGAPNSAVWNFRKAAWAVEDLEQDARLIYRSLGRKGLEAVPDLAGPALEMAEGAIRSA